MEFEEKRKNKLSHHYFPASNAKGFIYGSDIKSFFFG